MMTKYFAFISYKRGGLDEQVANWIHSKLEKYPYPVDMVSPNNRPEHESLIRRIYIDTKELSVAESDFSDDIKEALENSRYLIVVCSKRAAKSEYINNEVLYFLKTHNGQMLHASVLEFTHPVTGAHMRFKSRMPDDMTELKYLLDQI